MRLRWYFLSEATSAVVGFPLVTLTCVVIFWVKVARERKAQGVHRGDGWEHWMVKLQEAGETSRIKGQGDEKGGLGLMQGPEEELERWVWALKQKLGRGAVTEDDKVWGTLGTSG